MGEQAYAARMRRRQDQEVYVAAHALFRRAFTCVSGVRDFELGNDQRGRPELSCPGGMPWRFSLSHSVRLIACAFTYDLDIGLDVEAVGSFPDVADVAEAYFAKAEREYLASTTVSAKAENFYRFWTLKEAGAKAAGLGLALPLTEFSFALDPLTLTSAYGSNGNVAGWYFEEFVPAPNYRAALALRHPASAKRRVNWKEVDFRIVTQG